MNTKSNTLCTCILHKTFESGVLDNSDVHKALYKCKTDHGIAIGLSVSSPQQNEIIQKALSVEVDGTKLFDSVQCTYNIFEQKPGPMLEQAYTEYGIDIIVKEGMANGRILQNPIIKQYAQQLQCTPDALALACVLAQKFHPSVCLNEYDLLIINTPRDTMFLFLFVTHLLS